MPLIRLSQLVQWRAPLSRWTRGRLWQVYDRAYESLLGHASLHREWLAQAHLNASVDSLFSIGPGQGELELALCQELGCSFGYAESHPRYCREIERRFADAGLAGRIVERHQGIYEGFTPSRRYALILSVHSWYSFGYDAEVLGKTLAMLAPGGSLVLTITARDDWFFCNALARQTFSAEDLSRWATGQGFQHSLHRLRMDVPSERLVTGGALTDAAKGVVAFLKGRLWWRIPVSERRRIEARVLELPTDAKVERVYGLLHFRAAP